MPPGAHRQAASHQPRLQQPIVLLTGTIIIIIIIIIIIYLLKQEDAHMIDTRTRAGQERHRKLALTFCP